MRTVFHITTQTLWEEAKKQGQYSCDSLQREGFIHMCRPQQLLATAEIHYKGKTDLLLLQIGEELLEAPLKYEEARGTKFPHLYGKLNLNSVIAVFPFRSVDSHFVFPADFQMVGETLIRAGAVGDEAEVASVHTHAWQESYPGLVPTTYLAERPLSFRSRMLWMKAVLKGKEVDKIFVAESRDHGIVGFCIVGPARGAEFKGQGEISAIYCLNPYKKKHIGTMLLERGRRYLRTVGLFHHYLWVLKENPSIAFYEKMGALPRGMEKVIDLGAELHEVVYEWKSP